jgi:hypothetical protein
MIEKKSTAASTSNAQQAARSSQSHARYTHDIRYGYLIALWWVVHWFAGLIVTEYGILGGLVALGVIGVATVIMDHYDL